MTPISFSDASSPLVVLAIALFLGLRHATDPDHVVAVLSLVASGRERAVRRAAALGVAWGVGHAVTLFTFGLPILLIGASLPKLVERFAETLAGALIVALALHLLIRRCGHLHSPGPARTPLAALGIGLVHGIGGSAGPGVMLVAAVESTALAVAALAVLALFTAFSMTALSSSLGWTLLSRPLYAVIPGIVPVLGSLSLVFGLWYASAAWSLVPYPF